MTTIEREFLVRDARLKLLFDLIKSKHQVAEHTQRTLLKNRKIKDFCEEARHFIEMAGDKSLYLHYDVSSWYKKKRSVMIRIERIGIYEDFQEYQSARLKQLHATPDSSINLN
jgi:hypothetical protein